MNRRRIQILSACFLLGLLIALIFVPTPIRQAVAEAIAPPPPVQVASTFPLAIPPASAQVTSEFGPRQSFKTSTGYSSSNHKGIDIACKAGDPLIAVVGGTAIYIDSDLDGWGVAIAILSHSNDEFLYAHTSKRIAQNNTLVQPGEVIAECGESGSATDTHVHFEQWPQRGSSINPRPFLESLGLPPSQS